MVTLMNIFFGNICMSSNQNCHILSLHIRNIPREQISAFETCQFAIVLYPCFDFCSLFTLWFYTSQMKYQEEFFHDQIEKIHKATEEKEIKFEKLLQEERAKARQSDVDSGSTEDRRQR